MIDLIKSKLHSLNRQHDNMRHFIWGNFVKGHLVYRKWYWYSTFITSHMVWKLLLLWLFWKINNIRMITIWHNLIFVGYNMLNISFLPQGSCWFLNLDISDIWSNQQSAWGRYCQLNQQISKTLLLGITLLTDEYM